jgi:hypothetical protein
MSEAELEALVNDTLRVADRELLAQLQQVLTEELQTLTENERRYGSTLNIRARQAFITLGLNDIQRETQPLEASGGLWKFIKHLVCDEWKFCERRKEFADDTRLLASLIGFLMPLVDWPIRATVIVVVLAMHKGPGFMCNC